MGDLRLRPRLRASVSPLYPPDPRETGSGPQCFSFIPEFTRVEDRGPGIWEFVLVLHIWAEPRLGGATPLSTPLVYSLMEAGSESCPAPPCYIKAAPAQTTKFPARPASAVVSRLEAAASAPLTATSGVRSQGPLVACSHPRRDVVRQSEGVRGTAGRRERGRRSGV